MASALRIIAAAGVLTAAVLLAAPALAQTENSTGDGVDTSTDDDAHGTDPGSSTPDIRPTSTVGDGRNGDVTTDRVGPVASTPGRMAEPPPVSRAPGMSAYWEIPIVALNDLLRALKPKPKPGPALRTLQEEPPVIDSASGRGGAEPTAVTADAPRPFRVPLVTAPRLPLPDAPQLAAPAAPRAVASSRGGAVRAPAAQRPVVRGARESATSAQPYAPLRAPTIRGLPDYVRTPTAGELSLAALPGVAGLAMFTLGGGVIGYRQANSTRVVRNANVVRFLP
jgi:hypothetical protein